MKHRLLLFTFLYVTAAFKVRTSTYRGRQAPNDDGTGPCIVYNNNSCAGSTGIDSADYFTISTTGDPNRDTLTCQTRCTRSVYWELNWLDERNPRCKCCAIPLTYVDSSCSDIWQDPISDAPAPPPISDLFPIFPTTTTITTTTTSTTTTTTRITTKATTTTTSTTTPCIQVQYDPVQIGAGLPGASGAPVNARLLSSNDLQTATSSQVYYIENQFEELFTSSQLNLTRWRPSGSAPATTADGQHSTTPYGTQPAGPNRDHCPSAGAVGAASPATCTLLNPATLALGVPLNDYPVPTGSPVATGAVMTLSQRPCYNPDGSNVAACCSATILKTGQRINVCASWSGAHFSSQFGVQYGILEAEAKVNLPAESGAYLFFGTYMYGCQNATSNPVCDAFWNEIEELIYNDTTAGPTYGTSLFISKSSTQISNSVGYGQYNSAGLFSNHDSTGTCGKAACSPAQQAGLNCPAAPLAFPTASAAALASGMPASVAGGHGCPVYTSAMANSYVNYKLIWTPTWLAWMINNVVMRNESVAVRPGFVPWRPVTVRPLIRTNIGSAAIITGQCAIPYPCAGQKISVPAGLIQNTMTGEVIANHVIQGGAVFVNMTIDNDITLWNNGNCAPCNLLPANPPIQWYNVKLINAYVSFLPDASVSIRRFKYTPYNPTAVAAAMQQPNSWSCY